MTDPQVAVPDGDPTELRDVARFLRAAAEALTQVSSNVWEARSMVGTCWRGPAAYFFGQRVSQTIAAIDTTPPACHAAASTLERLADEIEETRRRALDAQLDAEQAQRRVDAAALEALAPGPLALVDPAVRYAAQRRLDDARHDLADARARGARATQDALDAGHRAAAALHAAADAVKAPPPPPGPDVVPFETTRQWFHRQLGDFLVDPMTFWSKDKSTYQRTRVAFDLYTGAGGGTVEGAARYKDSIFIGIDDVRVLRGPIVMKAVLETADYREIHNVDYGYKLGPDPVAGGTIAKVAQFAKFGGWALAGGTAALDQWVADRERRDLSGQAKIARMGASAFFVGGGSIAGATVGLQVGASWGSAIGSVAPGPGNVIGGVIGGIVGSTYGGGVGQAVGEKVKTSIFNVVKVN